ncbi:MAG: hypothetical protein ACTSYO_04750 [Candidatus Ranarchaeia archaeon]
MLDPGTLREISISFWSSVAAYYWLLFVYFGLVRYRRNKKEFFLFLSLFFLLLAAGRVLLIAYDFYFPTPEHNVFWRLGVFCQWISLGASSVIIGMILFKTVRRGMFLSVPAILFGAVNLILPPDVLLLVNVPVNYVAAFIYAIIIPALLFYVAAGSPGVIRTGFAFMGVGFLGVYSGRALHSSAVRLLLAPIVGDVTVNLMPPAIALIGLIFIVAGQNQAFEG